MRCWKLWVVMCAIALVVAACGGDDDEGATTSSSDTQVPCCDVTEQVVVELGDEKPFESQVGSVLACMVHSQLLRAEPPFDEDDTLPDGVTLLAADDIGAYVQVPDGVDPGDLEAAVAAVLERASYVDVGQMTDLATVEARLDELRTAFGNRSVSPVYAYGFVQGQWSFEPGGDPYRTVTSTNSVVEGLLEDDLTNLPFDESQPAVAVIDTGFPDLGSYGASIGLDVGDQSDTEPSHGAFVASIIQQQARASAVYGAKAYLSSHGYVDPTGLVGADFVRSGLTVEIALERLKIAIGSSDHSKVVLNLSLGTYECTKQDTGLTDATPRELRTALLDWSEGIDLAVYSAAGNQIGLPDFYPAAFGTIDDNGNVLHIVPVAATDITGALVMWNKSGGREAPAAPPKYGQTETVQALGVDLLGIGVANELGAWSGSSFATAVMTGLAASGNSIVIGQADADTLVAGATPKVTVGNVTNCGRPLVVEKSGQSTIQGISCP